MDINGIEKINGIIEYYHKHFLIIEIIILITIIFLAYLGYKFFKKICLMMKMSKGDQL
ncbi:hypothetical protein [Fusobacterium nucleatum]|uniref:hypothetical protein n=1 Tax=Fusobacterium nucleatum TaxID=851 RepID=UPI0003B8704F|nr:hypothetical protein [Fusobacterium nucleatum]ERT42618.1 hypothetical protein HMPREF1538_00176 [Fusobacterium nucleatum CTI-1]